MLLAGDVGGTNTRLALVEERGGAFEVVVAETAPSGEADGLWPLVESFLARHPKRVDAAGFGLPGPVTGRRVKTTNIPWVVDHDALEERLGAPVALVNDLVAAAHGALAARPEQLAILQEGAPARGARAVAAAGTGLGEAIIFRRGDELVPSASERGHASFAPQDDEEVELWRFARQRFGHVSYERLVSGPGLAVVYDFYRARLGHAGPLPWAHGEDPAAAVSRAAATKADPAAEAALARFCSIYGAEAGNLALKALAVEGVYLAGGIAPKILAELRRGGFLDAFLAKGRYRGLLSRVPVWVVLDDHLGLRGAARAASRLA